MQKIEPPPQGLPMPPPSPRFFFSFPFSRQGVLFFAYDDPQKSKKSGGWGRHWKSLWGGLYFLHKTGRKLLGLGGWRRTSTSTTTRTTASPRRRSSRILDEDNCQTGAWDETLFNFPHGVLPDEILRGLTTPRHKNHLYYFLPLKNPFLAADLLPLRRRRRT